MANAALASVLQQFRTMAQAKAYEETSDRRLLELFLDRREEAAFVALLKRHGPMVLQVCRRTQGNEQDAEDIFQATFLLLACKASSIRKRDSLASWLHGVAHRLTLDAMCLNHRRQARERRAAEMRKTSAVTDQAWQELQGTLDQALRQVPEKYRTPLVLCYLEGRTQEEAARRLGCPLGTVRSRLARGRDRLKTVLERQGVGLSSAALAGTLAQSDASATVPPLLLMATARAAWSYRAGKAATAVVSARAAALLERGVKAMLTVKLKVMTVVILATGALGLGAGAFGPSMLAGPSEVPAQAKPPETPYSNQQANTNAPAQPEKKTPPGAAQAAPGKESKQEITIRGRVLDSSGKPLAGAKLFVPRPSKPEPISEKDIAMDPVGVTDAEGNFSVSTRPSGFDLFYLVAYADGFGVDWVDLRKRKGADGILFRLPKDLPIAGRVVNTEGKPVAGVSVSAVAVFAPADDKLDKFLSGWQKNIRDTLSMCEKRMFGPLDGITGGVTTDKDGRFTLRGAGAERMVRVNVSGGGVARSTPYVITRPGFDPKPYNDVLLKKEYEDLRVLNRFLGLYPPTLTFVAEAGKTIEGVIKDAASGKPLTCYRVSAYTGWDDGVTAMSDANGKYRLDGIPKNARGYHVSVLPPKNTGYMNRTANAADTGGYTPVHLDIELTKGAVVTGRVVDKQTGKGVQAGIRFAPLPDNRFFGSKPGFDNYRHDHTMQSTNKDGRFRLSTIPGKALLTVQVHEGEKFNGQHLSPYRRAVPDPDQKDLFNYDKDDDTWTISTANSGIEFLSVEHAVRVIDIKENEQTKVELFVERGATARLAVEDPDGQPLSGAWVAGLADHWPITYKLPEATATVYALNPERPRTLVVFHPEKKVGGTLTIRGNEREPVIVKLAPEGKVIGRLLDTDGSPLSNAVVSINGRSEIARELYRFANPTGKPIVTDKDGRFILPGVVPGISFYVQTQKGNSYFTGKPRIGLLKVKPGESLDLGDRTMEVLR
jgi:RNA polymerase sigma factor (sigma-70 family)